MLGQHLLMGSCQRGGQVYTFKLPNNLNMLRLYGISVRTETIYK